MTGICILTPISGLDTFPEGVVNAELFFVFGSSLSQETRSSSAPGLRGLDTPRGKHGRQGLQEK